MQEFDERLHEIVEGSPEMCQRLEAMALAVVDHSPEMFDLSRVRLASWTGNDEAGELTVIADWDIGPPGDGYAPRQGVIGGELRLSGRYHND